MTREVTTTQTIYRYTELSEKAKEKALEWAYEGAFDHPWWEDIIYEDAARIGLKITGFDLDRNRHATGDYLTGSKECAEAIVGEHGESCETYKTAQAFLTKLSILEAKSESYDDEDYDEEREDLGDEFLKSILKEYSTMLQTEADYRGSREALEETISCNDWEFTEDGKFYAGRE